MKQQSKQQQLKQRRTPTCHLERQPVPEALLPADLIGTRRLHRAQRDAPRLTPKLACNVSAAAADAATDIHHLRARDKRCGLARRHFTHSEKRRWFVPHKQWKKSAITPVSQLSQPKAPSKHHSGRTLVAFSAPANRSDLSIMSSCACWLLLAAPPLG